MKQIITIQGTPIETYDDSVIQLNYKSNILGEIDKIETCHSYTYAIPNTTKNKALFRLSDVSDSEKKTNQFIPDVELFFNGIKIADGQIYIADVTPDEISIVFLFGMFSALKRIKDDDRKLYELNHKTGNDDFVSYEDGTYIGSGVQQVPGQFNSVINGNFCTLLVCSESTKSVNDQSGYNFPLCVKNLSLLDKIENKYSCTITGAYNAAAKFMIYKPKKRKYSIWEINAKKLVEANDRGTTEEEGSMLPWGYIADSYEITSAGYLAKNDYNDGITDQSQSLKSDSQIKSILCFVSTTVPNRITIFVNSADNKLEMSWYDDYTPTDDPVHEFNMDFPDPANRHILKKGSRLCMEVTALDKSTALNPTNFRFTVTGIQDNAEVDGNINYIDQWSTLPDWSIFDYLTSLSFTSNKAFFINTPTDQNLLQATSLGSIALNKCVDWSSKLDIDSVKHIYRNDDLGQTNVIQYTKDETDLYNSTNEIYSYYKTKDETLDAKKEFFTSKFRHSTENGMVGLTKSVFHPMEFFCDKEPVPGLVDTIGSHGGFWTGGPYPDEEFYCAKDYTELTNQNDKFLTYTLMNPHKIEAKFHLDVIDLFNIDFTHPIFLAQFGQIYYIEEIKFNAEESEVTLVELKNSDYR